MEKDATNETASYTGLNLEPKRTGGGATYITTPGLDAEEMYQVGTAGYQSGGTTIISTKSADTTNSDANSLPNDYDHTDRSAKWQARQQSTSQMPSEPSGDEPSI